VAQENINELITAYADGEITDSSKVNEIKDLIEKEWSTKFDYNVQLLMKSIIAEKLKIQPVPENVRKKVIRRIKPSKNFLISFISRIQS
jgi:hypothetical protein